MGAPYTFRNYRADLQVVFQNKVQMSQYRAVGHPIACAVTERLVDKIAEKAARDVFEIRSRNLIPDDAYPCTSPTGYQFEALSHHACLAKLRADDGLRPAARRAGAAPDAEAFILASASRRSSKSPIPVRHFTAWVERGFHRRMAPSSRSRRPATFAA